MESTGGTVVGNWWNWCGQLVKLLWATGGTGVGNYLELVWATGGTCVGIV